MEEIVNHGCQSGVCFKHIYYGDTIGFFDKYEDEIMDYFESCYDEDFLVNIFKDANCDLGLYKNSVCWAFIEAVACDITCEAEDTVQPLDTHMYHTVDGELVYRNA